MILMQCAPLRSSSRAAWRHAASPSHTRPMPRRRSPHAHTCTAPRPAQASLGSVGWLNLRAASPHALCLPRTPHLLAGAAHVAVAARLAQRVAGEEHARAHHQPVVHGPRQPVVGSPGVLLTGRGSQVDTPTSPRARAARQEGRQALLLLLLHSPALKLLALALMVVKPRESMPSSTRAACAVT